jgi:EAL domain-containing protein (putative c-di-GMP-specific phosphodiesterase class I)
VLFLNLHPEDLTDETLLAADSPLLHLRSRIVLEITERASIERIVDVRSRIAALRQAGYRVAVDDLGAGYSGLSSFVLLEPEVAKIDMALVRDVHRFPTKQRLIRSLADLCKDMGMTLIAEGVESTAERDVLIDLGCDLFQGYLFAQPGPAFPGVAF